MSSRSFKRTTDSRGDRHRGDPLPPAVDWHGFRSAADFPPGELERRTAALCDPDDALAVIRMVARREVASTVCLLLDDRHGRIAAVVITGEAGPPAAHALCELIEAMVLAAEPAVGAVVLGSVPAVDDSHECSMAELRERWRAGAQVEPPCALCELELLEERFDEIGVELVEWFLVAGDHAAALRQAGGFTSRWVGM